MIELLSESDSPKNAARKMQRWMENGVEVAWLGNPYNRTVSVYEAAARARIETGDKVAGTGPVGGFVLELGDVWGSYRMPS